MDNQILHSNSQYLQVPFDDFVSAQVELGSKYLDLVLQTPHVYVDSTKAIGVEGAKEKLSKKGISVVSVTALPYRYSLCAGRETMQGVRTIEYYKQCIKVAEHMGAKYLCLTGAGAPYDEDKETLLKNAVHNLSEICKAAEERDIVVLAGACFGKESPLNSQSSVLTSIDEICSLVSSIDSRNVGVYLDTELAAICGEGIELWFKKFFDSDVKDNKLKLIRFTDGNYNGYRTWGKGCLPGHSFLNQVMTFGFRGPISLQVPGEKYRSNPKEQDYENRLKFTAYANNVECCSKGVGE